MITLEWFCFLVVRLIVLPSSDKRDTRYLAYITLDKVRSERSVRTLCCDFMYCGAKYADGMPGFSFRDNVKLTITLTLPPPPNAPSQSASPTRSKCCSLPHQLPPLLPPFPCLVPKSPWSTMPYMTSQRLCQGSQLIKTNTNEEGDGMESHSMSMICQITPRCIFMSSFGYVFFSS